MVWDEFWSVICDHRYYVRFGLLFAILLLVFIIFSLTKLEPGTKSYTVALLDLILVGILAGATGGTLWYCGRWEQR